MNLHVVVKGTKTIEEYKATRARLEYLAEVAFEWHIRNVEQWEHGDPVKVWFNGDNSSIYVQYESGARYKYSNIENGSLVAEKGV